MKKAHPWEWVGSFTAEGRVCLVLGNDLLVVFKDISQLDEFNSI